LKIDYLCLLIFKIFVKYEKISYKQLIQLIEVYDPYEQILEKIKLPSEVFQALKKLECEYQIIFFDNRAQIWKIISNAKEILIKLDEKPIQKNLTFDPVKYKFKIIGKGNQFVYGLYVPSQKIDSIIFNYEFYPIKVGKTNKLERRIKELSISGIETLGIDIIFKTNYPLKLEKFIHKKLIASSKKIDISDRKEWFFINRRILEKLYFLYLKESVYF
jgi:hypothetical protein